MKKIEDYGIVGDTESVALVGIDGSIDWLCLPRFDSPAFFASLVGTPDNGSWRIGPVRGPVVPTRRYRPESLVLETDFRNDEGVVRLTDAMPVRKGPPSLVRIISGVSGAVRVRCDLRVRFDYGQTKPVLRAIEGGIRASFGSGAVVLRTPVALGGDPTQVSVEFDVCEGDKVPFVLTWHSDEESVPHPSDPFDAVEKTDRFWRTWASRCNYHGEYRDAVVRSLITVKALTYGPSGGIVAAPTTSLPESIGHERNWDYRYCWLRDATFALHALLRAGYEEDARAWRDWMLRALTGRAEDLRTLYGLSGEPQTGEQRLQFLQGYEDSAPVRVGNAASKQFQLDIYGEVMDALHQARRLGLEEDEAAWAMQREFANWLENNWMRPDAGLWELRGAPQHHTHSKVMAWVGLDRAVKAVEQHGLPGSVGPWRHMRDAIHRDVCAHGYHCDVGSFTQSYGADALDASLLLIPIMGFLPPNDPRVRGTIAAVERSLLSKGLVLRYLTQEDKNDDGFTGRDNTFIACSFWLADAYVLAGQREKAAALFERVLAVRNDLGLLSEEYDTARQRLVGNFPQTFSHVALINSAFMLRSDDAKGATARENVRA